MAFGIAGAGLAAEALALAAGFAGLDGSDLADFPAGLAAVFARADFAGAGFAAGLMAGFAAALAAAGFAAAFAGALAGAGFDDLAEVVVGAGAATFAADFAAGLVAALALAAVPAGFAAAFAGFFSASAADLAFAAVALLVFLANCSSLVFRFRIFMSRTTRSEE